MHPYPGSSWVRRRMVSRWFMTPLLVALALMAGSCGWFGGASNCHHEVHIIGGQGAEGMVPGTVRARRGQKICFTNDTNVQRTVRFADSPDEAGLSPKDIVLAPGQKKHIKVHRNKPLGTYDCHVDPLARTDGLWPPTEPQVIVE